MNFAKLHLFLVLFLGPLFCFSQSSKQVEVEWGPVIYTSVQDNQKQVLNFKGAHYHFDAHNHPLFQKKIRLPENTDSVQVQVDVLESVPLSALERGIIDLSQIDTQLSWRISYERKIPYLILSYVPLSSDRKVTRFEYHLNLIYKDEDVLFRSASVNSVLEHGEWYKIRVTEEGLYKIDRNFLSSMGLDISKIDPRNLQIYGNGGAMLPESNAEFRHEDLVENAIYVNGEEDGRFDAEDFIVFYGQSPHRWFLNSEMNFQHTLNIYDDHNYYFLHLGTESGKRISSVNPNLSENTVVDFYTDKKFHELENKNLKNSGRQWFGEYFAFNEGYTMSFAFQNRLKTEPVRIKARGVARSSSATRLSFSHTGAEVLSVPFSRITSDEPYVDAGEAEAEFVSNFNSLDVQVSYNKNGNSSAFAYLDYIEVQAKSKLLYEGGQLIFSEPSTVAQGNVTKFNISSAEEGFIVWDVTDPTQTQALSLSNGSFTCSTSDLRTFVIHDLNPASYLTPVFQEQLSNQNLHGHEAADLLIITAPEFLESAQRLAALHTQEDGIAVRVATTNEIYNEFSSGKQDLVALRSYIRMMYDKADTEDELPKNVLLFGDASFDYKGIGVQNNSYTHQNFVPTFQSQQSFSLGPSYCTDDFLTFLDGNEGAQNTMRSDGMDVGVGRMVVQTQAEAAAAVDKIAAYYSQNALGDWRSNICFVADDIDDESWEHVLQANIDKIAEDVDTNYHNYNINKIYLDAYRQVSSSGGERYPDARQAIIDQVNKGALILHYYGHGGEVGLAEERVLELSDINSWKNINNLPVFVTATCEFSRYDDPKRVSAGERVFLNPEGAGIALFTTTRTIFESDAKNLSKVFYKYALPEQAGEHLTFGQIMMGLKNDLNSSGISSTNKLKFTLLGDPALKFPIPQLKVVVNEVLNAHTNLAIDTLKALTKVKVKGAIQTGGGQVVDAFNGVLKPKLFDKSMQLQTLRNDFENLDPFQFSLQQSLLYSGKVSVVNGEFEFEFVVPKDISFVLGRGKFSLYAFNEKQDALGAFDGVSIGGYDSSAASDDEGPTVELYMNHSNFRSGGITDSNPSLYALIRDESGVNTSGNGIGHDLVATLDEDQQSSVVLNSYYESDLDSYQSGVVVYPYTNLEEGLHQLKLKVWDVHNNSSEAFTEFVVVTDTDLLLQNLMNYPNPFREFTQIHFEHNRPDEDLEVTVTIFDTDGRKVKTMNATISASSYANSDFTWDGTSDSGSAVKSGLYFCRVHAFSNKSGDEGVLSNQMILIR